MKTITLLMALVGWMFSANLAQAGEGSSCHFHGSKAAEESTIIQCANQRRDLYLRDGTIESSWTDISPAVVEIVDGQKGQEWRVRFDNANASEAGKSKLYMFFSLPGNFIAANYSGR